MLDWTQITKDPISTEVRGILLRELRLRKNQRCFDKHELVRSFVEGRSILDVGVVEHAMNHADASSWLHGKVKNWAREVVGVDILEEEAASLRKRGYEIFCVDATSEVDLGRRFDCVLMGDILEHVSNPVNLLRFGARHLVPGGRILATTPNPFYLAWLLESFRYGVQIANAEHVSWISPTMALEIGRRAGLDLSEYRLIQAPRNSGSQKLRLLHLARELCFREQEIFSHAYAYVFSKYETST